MTRTLITFGAGPGIGNHVSAEFASKGINHIILLARNEQRLKNEDAPVVSEASSSVKVDTLRIDLCDIDSVPSVLEELDSMTKGEDVEVIFFNAARIKSGEVMGVSVQEIDEDFKASTLSLYIIAQHYIPKLQSLAKSNKAAKPALLVTSSHLPWDPAPPLLSLSLTKASQMNMVQNLARAFADVHIGLIHVEGVVSPEMKKRSPTNIARETVEFWERGEGVGINIKE